MAEKKRIELMACAGTACVAGGSFHIMEALKLGDKETPT